MTVYLGPPEGSPCGRKDSVDAGETWHCDKLIRNHLSNEKTIHTYIHTYMHTCIHAYMHTCIHAYMQTSMHACMHAWYVHTCIHVFARLYRSNSLHVHNGTHERIYIFLYVYVYLTYTLMFLAWHALSNDFAKQIAMSPLTKCLNEKHWKQETWWGHCVWKKGRCIYTTTYNYMYIFFWDVVLYMSLQLEVVWGFPMIRVKL